MVSPHFSCSVTSVAPSWSVCPSCAPSSFSFGFLAMTFSKWLHSDSTGANSVPTWVTSSRDRFSLLMFWRTSSRLWKLGQCPALLSAQRCAAVCMRCGAVDLPEQFRPQAFPAAAQNTSSPALPARHSQSKHDLSTC